MGPSLTFPGSPRLKKKASIEAEVTEEGSRLASLPRRNLLGGVDRKASSNSNMNKAADQAEICGGLSTLQAFHGSKDERLSSGHHNHHHQQSSQSLQVRSSLPALLTFPSSLMNKLASGVAKHRMAVAIFFPNWH
jgi:hypothetical protein